MTPFLRYVAARIKREARDEIYRIYVTDTLKSICGAKKRYYDMIHESEITEADPEEIKTNIVGKLKALGNKNGN